MSKLGARQQHGQREHRREKNPRHLAAVNGLDEYDYGFGCIVTRF